MKFQLTFKTPDAMDQLNLETEEQKHDITVFLEKWVKWGELVTIEFDSVRGTAKVIPAL